MIIINAAGRATPEITTVFVPSWASFGTCHTSIIVAFPSTVALRGSDVAAFGTVY